MLRVSMRDTKDGMVLAMPVHHPERPSTVLLKAGLRLESRIIDRLRELGLTELWIRYPGMEVLADSIDRGVLHDRARLVESIDGLFTRISASASGELDYTAYRDALTLLMGRMLSNGRTAELLEEIADHARPALRHACNVCFLSLLLGLQLDGYVVAERSRLRSRDARDLTSLGMAAMLHDVGMLRLPAAALDRWNRDHDEADDAWRSHVVLGWELVRDRITPAASGAVLHHHQRFDGTGFPLRSGPGGRAEKSAGSDIHIYARIIAAADLVDRLRDPADAPGSEGLGLPTRPTVRALAAMRRPPYAAWIDPMVFKGLIAVLPPYPPGAMVELSNGQTCVVTEWSIRNPCRPVVHTVAQRCTWGEPGDGEAERIDLAERRDLFITRCDGHDVSADNFDPAYPDEFDPRAGHRAAAKPGQPGPDRSSTPGGYAPERGASAMIRAY